jgi:hypothetical protein
MPTGVNNCKNSVIRDRNRTDECELFIAPDIAGGAGRSFFVRFKETAALVFILQRPFAVTLKLLTSH